MTLSQKITALLDGELADGAAVDELLHVLSVSPEKRTLLVEQIALKRHIAASTAAVAPPAAADRAVLGGLAAIDASFGGGTLAQTPARTPIAPAPTRRNPLLLAVLALVLLAGGGFGGYVLAPREAQRGVERAVAFGNATVLQALQDSIDLLHGREAGLIARLERADAGVRDLNLRLTSTRGPALAARSRGMSSPGAPVTQSTGSAERRLHQSDAAKAEAFPRAARSDISPIALRGSEQALTQLTQQATPRNEAPEALAVDAGVQPRSVMADMSPVDDVGPWQAAFRTHLRHSVPRVYGLTGRRSALFDKEFLGSVAVGGEGAPIGPLRIGAAFGETQFSIAFHTNEGGALRDSIVELAPTSLYVRGFVAPELVRIGGLSGAIELGGGYTFEAGGFGSAGINLEYHPTPEVSLHLGGSAWMLLTQRAQSIYLSTNLNGHIGVAYGF